MRDYTYDDLRAAIVRLSRLNFFRHNDPEFESRLTNQLFAMMPSKEALVWTIEQIEIHCKDLPSIQEIRGILCWKYRPLDKIEAPSTLPGFRPTDGEENYLRKRQIRAADRLTLLPSALPQDPDMTALVKKTKEAMELARKKESEQKPALIPRNLEFELTLAVIDGNEPLIHKLQRMIIAKEEAENAPSKELMLREAELSQVPKKPSRSEEEKEVLLRALEDSLKRRKQGSS